MRSMKFKFALIILAVGLLSACGGQPTEASASQSTAVSAPATATPTDTTVVPTDTALAQSTKASMIDPGAPVGTVSFANDVLPLLQSRCANCHGGDQTKEGLSVRTYADLLKGSDNGPVILPGDSENSLLVELVSTQEMPKRGPKLTPPQIQLIIDWVNQGALDN